MRWWIAATACLLVSVASSGCLVSGDGKEGTQSTDGTGTSGPGATGSATKTGTKTSSASATGTTSPQGNASANITATLTASAQNGSAPLNVTFNVTGSGPSPLTWTLDVDGEPIANGTSLPGNATHSFTEAGNHTVTLVVRSGSRNATANLTITVTEGDGGAATATEDDWVVFNADGTCDAKGEIDIEGIYLHERGDPPGTGYALGGGTWVYEETNGLPGMQVGGAGESAEYVGCLNPDTIIF